MSKFMAKVFEKIQRDRFTPIENSKIIKINVKILRRVHLNECVKYISQLNGIYNRIKFNADDLSLPNIMQCVDMALAQPNRLISSLKRVRRQLFRETRRESRKSLRPRKRTGNEDLLNFVFNAKSKSSLYKVRRGYLNEARSKVEREMCAKKNIFEGIKPRFHCTAREWISEAMYSEKLARILDSH